MFFSRYMSLFIYRTYDTKMFPPARGRPVFRVYNSITFFCRCVCIFLNQKLVWNPACQQMTGQTCTRTGAGSRTTVHLCDHVTGEQWRAVNSHDYDCSCRVKLLCFPLVITAGFPWCIDHLLLGVAGALCSVGVSCTPAVYRTERYAWVIKNSNCGIDDNISITTAIAGLGVNRLNHYRW